MEHLRWVVHAALKGGASLPGVDGGHLQVLDVIQVGMAVERLGGFKGPSAKVAGTAQLIHVTLGQIKSHADAMLRSLILDLDDLCIFLRNF